MLWVSDLRFTAHPGESMTSRKLTSLVIMVGLMVSLFQPLAHAWSSETHGHAGTHGHTGILVQSMDQIVHIQDGSPQSHKDDFATDHCDVCHVFAHMFVMHVTELSRPSLSAIGLPGGVSTPLAADVLLFDRPPRVIF